MSKSLWQWTAAREAENLVDELGITAFPVSPFEIAEELGIEVRALPADSRSGVSGMLLRQQNLFGILYATSIDSAGFQRFSVGHEIGHYCLPGHPECVLRDGAHASHAGFGSKDRYELEADHFSASLLMPTTLFDKALASAGNGIAAVEHLATTCETSLVATAIRFSQRSPDPAAIIVSIGNHVDYCFMSDTLKEADGLEWIRKGSLLPPNSATKELNGDPKKVLDGERLDAEGTVQDWFGGDIEAQLVEETIGLGDYGKTLTILTVEELPDAEEIEDEEELEESWTPRFKR